MNIKTRPMMVGLMVAGCAICTAFASLANAQATDSTAASPTPAANPSAPVSQADFQKLLDSVQKLSDQVQKLQQANETQQQTHQDDLQQIQQLETKLDQTQQTAQDAEQKSTAAAQSQSQTAMQAPIDEATVNHNFQILGDAEFQYAKADHQHGAFAQADFAPIFLYRAGDNILFESGFDFILQNNAQGVPGTSTPGNPSGGAATTTVNLSFAQLDYVINDYVTLAAGELLLPLGTYSQRSAGWLNKFPDNPQSRDLLPGVGLGPMLQGAIPIGHNGAFMNYSIFGVNGPSSTDGSGNAAALDLAGNVGLTSGNSTANLHENLTGGGRLGFFMPFPKPHYDMEVGISGETGEWDNAATHHYTAGVLDAALHLGPFIEAKGEYIKTWYGSDDLGEIEQDGYWAQAGYKLAGLNLDLPVIKNLELMGRYDSINDGMGNSTQTSTVGYVYYFTNTLLFEGDYEFLHNTAPGTPTNNVIFQLSLGF